MCEIRKTSADENSESSGIFKCRMTLTKLTACTKPMTVSDDSNFVTGEAIEHIWSC